jgi:hypothetical protein
MKEQVKNEFYKLSQQVNTDSQTHGIHQDGQNGSKFQITMFNDLRVPSFLIVTNVDGFNELTADYQLTPNMGEMTMLELFKDIYENENEQWIVDTDILNWNIKVGSVREYPDIQDELNSCHVGSLQYQNFFKNMDESDDNIYCFLFVQLNDYMS